MNHYYSFSSNCKTSTQHWNSAGPIDFVFIGIDSAFSRGLHLLLGCCLAPWICVEFLGNSIPANRERWSNVFCCFVHGGSTLCQHWFDDLCLLNAVILSVVCVSPCHTSLSSPILALSLRLDFVKENEFKDAFNKLNKYLINFFELVF